MLQSNEHFNGLHPAEAERLAKLIEECSEVQKCCTKILRHGYDSRNPHKIDSRTNREHLADEVGEMNTVIEAMLVDGDMDSQRMWEATTMANEAWSRGLYLHHNGGDAGGSDA